MESSLEKSFTQQNTHNSNLVCVKSRFATFLLYTLNHNSLKFYVRIKKGFLCFILFLIVERSKLTLCFSQFTPAKRGAVSLIYSNAEVQFGTFIFILNFI